ncbi:hypothetical protein LTR95_012818 [Oleoguttula sp. CCFEE 5521]
MRVSQPFAAATAVLLSLLVAPSYSAYIAFENCLAENTINSNPRRLQWVPLFVDAKFDTVNPTHGLNLTYYGNVTGQTTVGEYPPPNDPGWSNENNTFGKITDIGTGGNYSTLITRYNLLTYDAYSAPSQRFCTTLVNGSCPIGPYFNANASNPYDLPAFRVQHDFGSTYAFGTLVSTVRVISGDEGAPDVLCVSANITPDLGKSIAGLITWLPAAILILKGLATLTAAIWSPWGSADIFRWSSNYGRDEDLLRLVTPGFGDCLQYIQFVALTGSLTLQYPGFFQPAVSQTTWSLLMFNQSFVSHGDGYQSLVDGVYTTSGTYGMSRMSQLVGMSKSDDIWACMAIWLLVIAVIVVVLCQIGFAARWAYRKASNISEEDLRRKNFPFTVGNLVRLLFNYFILPIAALSLFQLVIAPRSPRSVVICAVILLLVILLTAIWILRVIFQTKPRTHLFDDMPTVLMYGPLYNTYSDSAAPFALIPVAITFMRAVAIGAVQPSGIGQLIILAICEVIFILTLNAFRPFQNQTSMNAYHTFFATVRLVTILLSVAFVPSLGVDEAPRGWIGYAILLLHACVLVFGFFLNAAQTLIEVVARSMGVAGDAQHGAIRGSIVNIRMLKKRQNRNRPITSDRASMASGAAILQDADARSNYARSRSMSASSQQLLNQIGRTPSTHRMSGFENFDSIGGGLSSPTGESGNNPMDSAKPVVGGKVGDAPAETYYRPPRARRTTMDALPLAAKAQQSGNSADFPYSDSPTHSGGQRGSSIEGKFVGRDSPAPAYFRDRADSDDNLARPDYAVREVDQYYRGAALSDQPTRKLKTGPVDPNGPAANAQSWFQRFVGGKAKPKESKGFEVVRSSRMPPEMQRAAEEHEMVDSPPMASDPYQDSPPLRQHAAGGADRAASPASPTGNRIAPGFNFALDGTAETLHPAYSPPADTFNIGLHPAARPSADTVRTLDHPGMRAELPARPRPSGETTASSRYPADERDEKYRPHLSDVPSLAPIEPVGGLDLPSRFGSQRTQNDLPSPYHPELDRSPAGQEWLRAVDDLSWPSHNRGDPFTHPSRPPYVPRRSSRRTLSQDQIPTLGGTHSPPLGSSPDEGLEFEGFDSTVGSPPAPVQPGFASSHKRAGDSLTRNELGAQATPSQGVLYSDGYGGR